MIKRPEAAGDSERKVQTPSNCFTSSLKGFTSSVKISKHDFSVNKTHREITYRLIVFEHCIRERGEGASAAADNRTSVNQ